MRRAVTLALGAFAACGGGGDGGEKACDRTVAGHICTIAGNGENGYAGEDGPALEARLSLVMDTLTDTDGSVYVVDWNNHRIRKVTPDGIIHFIAGNGELGGSLDDPATGDFNHPTGIIFDPTGAHIYISAWHNSKVRVLDPATGVVTDSCGDGRRAYIGDGTPALTASLDLPTSIAWDPQNNLTILDEANQVIRKVDASGTIQRIAGQCVIDAPAPNGPGLCADGVAPTACPGTNKSTCGDPAMWCGKPCSPGYSGDEIPASEMRMAQAVGQAADPGGRIAYDKQGNLYFADTTNNIIRMIDPAGMVHRVAGTAPPIHGVSQPGYSGDGGPALDAQLNHPVDLALADDGTMYFTDVFNHCVRAIAPDQTIRTVVGVCGTKGFAGDGDDATKALLNRPYGVEWVAPDTLYVADTGNSVVRAVRLP
jgi:DNA-binding beta-propeller fold protein YncE